MIKPCGCRVSQPNQMIDPVVKFCPLHAAAEEMYGALEMLLEANGLYKEVRERVITALAVAHGQEPADDSEMPLGPIKAPARGLES